MQYLTIKNESSPFIVLCSPVLLFRSNQTGAKRHTNLKSLRYAWLLKRKNNPLISDSIKEPTSKEMGSFIASFF